MKVLHNGRAIIVKMEELDLSQFPDLEVIGCPMTGVEHLPIKEIEERGIKLITLQGRQFFLKDITSTAEHTFGLILALLRNYKTALNAPYKDREEYIGYKLSEKTLGIVGFGRVGQQMAKIAHGFGMKVITYDKFNTRMYPHSLAMRSLEALLKHSDIVSIHVPLPGNEGFFGVDHFEMMNPSAFLINTSRDGVIQHGALRAALESNIIRGAAVDFIDDEELVEYASSHNNLVITNHIAGITHEDRELTDRYIELLVNNFISNSK